IQKLLGSQRMAVLAARNPRQVQQLVGLVRFESAGRLRRGALAHHDDVERFPRDRQAVLHALHQAEQDARRPNDQPRAQHGHHGRFPADPEVPDVILERNHGDQMTLLSPSTTDRFAARTAGQNPLAKPTNNETASPWSATFQGMKKTGRKPAMYLATSTSSKNPLQPSEPTAPPMPATSTDSVRTRKSTRFLLKPTAFTSATSLVRSRLDIAMTLPATHRREKTSARPIARIMSFMSPSISSTTLPKASSTRVRVGKSLLRYRSSIFLHTDGMTSPFLHLMKIMPAFPDTRALAG